MITGVKMQRWRSHMDSVFTFDRGTNALIGIMGSGKSSVLDAISFALYGTFPSLKAKKLSLDDVVMSSPQEMKSAFVEVSFSADGKNYSVSRTIEKKKGTKADLREGGKLIETGPSPVAKSVSDILKMDYELFSRAVYSEQDRLDFFLTIPKGQRMRIIDNLLKIDLFEEARQNCVSVSNRFDAKGRDERKLLDDIERGVDIMREKTLEEEINRSAEERKVLEDDIGRKRSELKSIEKETLELEEKISNAEAIKVSIGREEGALEALKKEIGSLRIDAVRSPKELEEAVLGIENMIRKLSSLETDARSEIGSLNLRKKELDNSKEKISGMSKCPVCLRELDEAHKGTLGLEFDNEKDRIERRLAHLQKEASNIHGKRATLEKERTSLEAEMRKSLQSERDMLRKGTIQGDITRLENSVVGKKRELQSLDSGWQREALRDKLSERESLIKQESALSERLRSLKSMLSEKEASLKIIRERKALMDGMRGEIETLALLVSELKSFNSSLVSTQEELRRIFIDDVNDSMARIWEYIYPYGDFSSARLSIVSGDYELELLRKDGWSHIDLASGGERSTACLALRIAFSLALAPNLRWLVLDEPTHNLDSKTVESLAILLREKASSLVEQIFLITHDERLEDSVTGYLYRLERDKDKGEATRVEMLVGPETV